jgi:hypothetical protein
MIKHWQQIEREAMERMATYHRERANARRSQQIIKEHFKAVIRASRRIVSRGERVLEFVTVPVRR